MSRLARLKNAKTAVVFIDFFCHNIFYNLVIKWWRYHIFSCQNDANLELVVVLDLEFKALYYYFDIWSHLQHDLSFCFSLLILMKDYQTLNLNWAEVWVCFGHFLSTFWWVSAFRDSYLIERNKQFFALLKYNKTIFKKLKMHFIVGPGGICTKERMCIYYVNFTLLLVCTCLVLCLLFCSK